MKGSDNYGDRSNDPNDNRCLKILDRLMQLEAENE